MLYNIVLLYYKQYQISKEYIVKISNKRYIFLNHKLNKILKIG